MRGHGSLLLTSRSSPAVSASVTPGPPDVSKPVRAAAVPTAEAAARLVERLTAAGFGEAAITVLSSDEQKEAHFRRYEHQDPAGAHSGRAAAVGGLVGLAAGAAAGLLWSALEGWATFWADPLGQAKAAAVTGAGAILGAVVGVMLTRGAEGELADFYDQAVREGAVLVGAAVDPDAPAAAARLAAAEAAFAAEGLRPVALEAG